MIDARRRWTQFHLALCLCAALLGCSATVNDATVKEEPPLPFVQTLPGSTVTFTMRPVSVSPNRVVWFAETETTWNAYDVFYLRLDEVAAGADIASIGAEGPDAITRPTLPYVAPDHGLGHAGYPAIGMSFHAALKYCDWLTEKTGKRYRLPTAAEWRAAAAGDISASNWFADNSDDTTHSVASAGAANANGLHDLFGNVAEWCSAPDGGAVACGGSFQTVREELEWDGEHQTRAWNASDPSYPKSKWWLRDAPFVGFRVVCEDRPK